MKKKFKLKDGTGVVIRKMHKGDLERSLAFFRALPEEDREYLRSDVTKRDVVERRIKEIRSPNIIRLVALVDDQIVADGSLEMERTEWKKHVAEIRLIVAHQYQHQGLGTLMAHELFFTATGKKVEEITAKFMAPQVRAQKIFERLGFHREAELHDYVKDIHGHKQDMVVMCCDLESLWKKLDEHIHDFDWRRTR
jgi:RimJ/RimL family protein N-acetyltransferase